MTSLDRRTALTDDAAAFAASTNELLAGLRTTSSNTESNAA
jgi:hypothetical protein